MPRVRALRGVCVGVGQVLLPGEARDIDESLSKFLVSIGAVELAPEPPPIVETKFTPPATAGKKEK